MKTKAALLLMLLTSLAYGATQYTRIVNAQVLGKSLMGTTTEANAITRSLAGRFDYDFGAVTITCEDSVAITTTGALVGDACEVGIPAFDTSDGGNGLNSHFDCYVSAADAVKVRHCGIGTETDPPDAGYSFRTFSVQ